MLTSHFGYPMGNKGRNGMKITKIFVHHMAGILTAQQCGNVFKTREASAHYGIGSDGKIGQYVLEENPAWHCASYKYNCCSIGIELSNSTGAAAGWKVSDETIKKCIDLIVDICKRNDISEIRYTGDLSGNLCMHSWVVPTACPGPYLSRKFIYIADEVNKKLGVGKSTKKTNTSSKTKKAYSGAFPSKTIMNGSTGKQVKYLQKFLNWYDSKNGLEEDGIFGAMTEKAVKKFQKSNKISADGVVGPLTIKAMKATKK